MNDFASLPGCPDCGCRLSVDETVHVGGDTFRKLRCGCGQRFESKETIVRRLPPVVARARRRTPVDTGGHPSVPVGTGGHPPPPVVTEPPANARGVGGDLPGISSQSLSKPDPNPGSLENPKRGRARTKPDANPHHAKLIAHFVDRWQVEWSDKYAFSGRDASALASMLKTSPHLVDRWSAMVSRFFTDGFWSSKRNPLWALCANALQFAGDTPRNGVPTKWDDSRNVTLEFMGDE